MNKSPAFQFYAAEFLADENVVMMSNQEVGCYIKLMAYCWREGSIPSDISKIGKLCGEDGSAMAQLWLSIGCCFRSASTSDRLIHKRLENEREKQEKYRAERSESGKKGAKAKWNNDLAHHGSTIAQPMAQPMATDGSSSSSSSSTSTSSSTSSLTSLSTTKATSTTRRQAALCIPESVSDIVWQDFLSTRKTKLTQTALTGIAKQADIAGISLEAALQECCTRGWQSFKAAWVQQGQPKKTQHQLNQEAIARSIFPDKFKTDGGTVYDSPVTRLLD